MTDKYAPGDIFSMSPPPEDNAMIIIHWDNKSDYNRHKVALEIQDAGNLRALAREFVKVVDQAMDENQSTIATWEDPAVVLFVDKFASLCRVNQRYQTAYKTCQEKAVT